MTISTPEDFRKRKEELRAAKAEELTLPSGLVIRAYRPSPEWHIRYHGRLPQGMAARAKAVADGGSSLTADELKEFTHWLLELVMQAVVEPKIALNPGPNEIDPNDIDEADQNYIERYARGEISADGQDLGMFPRKPADASGGTGSDDVQFVAKQVNRP